MRTIHNIKEFNTLIESNKPILLDFYADWCGPCQALLPTIENLADEYSEKVEIAKINVDQNQEIAAHFKVKSIPTLYFLKDKEVINKMQGLQSKKTLTDYLDKLS